MLKTYGFDFLGHGDQVEAVDLAEHADHAEATRHARRQLAQRLTAVAVNVWCDGELIARVDAPAPPSPPPQAS